MPHRTHTTSPDSHASDGLVSAIRPASSLTATATHATDPRPHVVIVGGGFAGLSAAKALADAPVRYIVDDCLKFARRELKRGRRYDAVIMDPPTYGRGSSGEMWRLEDNLWELLKECRALLSDTPLFLLINAYTARLSPTVVANLLAELMPDRAGRITAGEVGLPVRSDGKVLPCGIYGRWEAAG